MKLTRRAFGRALGAGLAAAALPLGKKATAEPCHPVGDTARTIDQEIGALTEMMAEQPNSYFDGMVFAGYPASYWTALGW